MTAKKKPEPVTVLGVDPSLTSTGVAWDGVTFRIRPKRTGVDRMTEIRDALVTYVDGRRINLVVLEGLAFSTHSSSVTELAGLHWVLRVALRVRRVQVAIVPPSTLKKFATGKGNVDKGAVLVEAVRRLGYDGSSHDEADALWLFQMGLHHTHHPSAVALPQTHLASLGAVDWADPVTSVKKVIRRSS